MCFSVLANDFFIIDETKIDSFAGLEESSDSIFVGSSIRYNLSFHYNGSKSDLDMQSFQVQIINPNGDILEEENFSLNIQPNLNYSVDSSIDENLYKLIYADVPGVYKLLLTSNSYPFYESKKTGFRQDKSIPFFFEVRRLEEKRLIDSSESIAKESSEINKKLLKLTNNIYVATLVMLVVALLTLYTSPKGRDLLVQIIKVGFYVIGAILILFILYQLFS
jgi:hypothetical protein|tara:strand:- start:964 stop:1626 length:663 start_codon:yes stop_codon:yes gene_type:complete